LWSEPVDDRWHGAVEASDEFALFVVDGDFWVTARALCALPSQRMAKDEFVRGVSAGRSTDTSSKPFP
jgi:hypothetical protein